jgi:hypothetical protein
VIEGIAIESIQLPASYCDELLVGRFTFNRTNDRRAVRGYLEVLGLVGDGRCALLRLYDLDWAPTGAVALLPLEQLAGRAFFGSPAELTAHVERRAAAADGRG